MHTKLTHSHFESYLHKFSDTNNLFVVHIKYMKFLFLVLNYLYGKEVSNPTRKCKRNINYHTNLVLNRQKPQLEDQGCHVFLHNCSQYIIHSALQYKNQITEKNPFRQQFTQTYDWTVTQCNYEDMYIPLLYLKIPPYFTIIFHKNIPLINNFWLVFSEPVLWAKKILESSQKNEIL